MKTAAAKTVTTQTRQGSAGLFMRLLHKQTMCQNPSSCPSFPLRRSENDQFILRKERPRLVSNIRDSFMLVPFSKRISPLAIASSQIERWGQLRRHASASE